MLLIYLNWIFSPRENNFPGGSQDEIGAQPSRGKLAKDHNHGGLGLHSLWNFTHIQVGLNLGKIDTNGVRLNFWDLGGQEELQALWDKYYQVRNPETCFLPNKLISQECHAIIYVVDSSDRERIEQSKETFNSMIKNENVRGVPLLVAANKQDLVDCMGVREVKPLFEANIELVGAREVMTLATSGLTGDGVVEGIDWVAQCVVRNADVRAPHDSAR